MPVFNNEFYKIFLESVSECILVANKNSEIVYANAAVRSLFGYTEQELKGQRLEILIPQRYKSHHHQHTEFFFKHPGKRKMSERDEIYGQSKNGELIAIEIGLNYFESEGETFAIAIISDISKTKIINLFLRDLHQIISDSSASLQKKLQTILALGCRNFKLPIGILSKIDGDNYEIVEIVAPEPYRAQFIKEQPCQLDHTYCHDVIESEEPVYITKVSSTKEHSHPCYQKWKMETYIGMKVMVEDQLYGTINFSSPDVSNSNISITEFEILKMMAQWISYMLLEDNLIGKMKQFNSQLEGKIASRTQELKHALSEIQDINISLQEEIAKRKEAEESANASLEVEKQLNHLKSRFVSTASHEFRTPLTGILSSVTLIDKYAAPEHEEKRTKHINIIKSSVKNLTNILNDFLSLSKLESGNIRCEPNEFNLPKLVKETIEEVFHTLKSGQKIDLTVHVEDGFTVFQDEKMLKNVVINLISNASKYSAEKQSIEIIISAEEQHFLIQVKDHGIGIPKSDYANMFDRFFRASNSTAYQGTGLGLNITRKNVELMQGEIYFESEEHVETIFTLKLPITYHYEEENTDY
jgi:PAS domain S-box-containing protein